MSASADGTDLEQGTKRTCANFSCCRRVIHVLWGGLDTSRLQLSDVQELPAKHNREAHESAPTISEPTGDRSRFRDITASFSEASKGTTQEIS